MTVKKSSEIQKKSKAKGLSRKKGAFFASAFLATSLLFTSGVMAKSVRVKPTVLPEKVHVFGSSVNVDQINKVAATELGFVTFGDIMIRENGAFVDYKLSLGVMSNDGLSHSMGNFRILTEANTASKEGTKSQMAYLNKIEQLAANNAYAYIGGCVDSQVLEPNMDGDFTTYSGSGMDGFIARIGMQSILNGNPKVESWTYLGGEGEDCVSNLKLTPNGLVATLETTSANLPSKASYSGGQDGYVIRFSGDKLDADLASATYIGTSNPEYCGNGDFDAISNKYIVSCFSPVNENLTEQYLWEVDALGNRTSRLLSSINFTIVNSIQVKGNFIYANRIRYIDNMVDFIKIDRTSGNFTLLGQSSFDFTPGNMVLKDEKAYILKTNATALSVEVFDTNTLSATTYSFPHASQVQGYTNLGETGLDLAVNAQGEVAVVGTHGNESWYNVPQDGGAVYSDGVAMSVSTQQMSVRRK